MILGCVLFLISFGNIIAKGVSNGQGKEIHGNRRISDVDALLDGLAHTEWGEDEAPCLEATLAMLHGVKNRTLWATWMWDSMQRPTGVLYGSRYQLGNFDQCLKPLWGAPHPHLQSQYCLADIQLSKDAPIRHKRSPDPYGSLASYIKVTSKHGRHQNLITQGICVSSVCRMDSVTKIVRLLHQDTHLASSERNTAIRVHSCQVAEESHQYTKGFYVFLALTGILTLITLLSTACINYLPPNTLVRAIANSFNLERNMSMLMKTQSEEMRIMTALKSICSLLTIIAHCLLFSLFGMLNTMDVDKTLDHYIGMTIININIAIDTFYVMSALVTTKCSLTARRRSMFGIVKRYIRLMGPMAMMVFYMSSVHIHVGDGPLWPTLNKDVTEFCTKNWWLNLLLINNFVNENEMCIIVTWYISTDVQLAIFGTFLCWLYWKNERLGKIAFAVSLVLAVLVPGLVTYWKELPALLIYDLKYIKTYCRAGTYLIGMAMGYLISRFRPSEYRNCISKKWTVISFLAALMVLGAHVATGGMMFHRDFDTLEAVVFAATNRLVWAVAICWIIGLFEYGTFPNMLNDFINLKLFDPLNRLCYCVYVCHMAVVYLHVHSIRAPMTYGIFSMGIVGIGVTVLVLFFSVLLWLFVEAPVCNISDYLLDPKRGKLAAQKETATAKETQNGSKTKEL